MAETPKPVVKFGSHLALTVDARGLCVYGNQAGLTSLAERLLRIAEADPKECFECHTRMELGGPFGLANPGRVSLIIDKKLETYFSRVPDDAPPDAQPAGFELTFMHIDDAALDELNRAEQDGAAGQQQGVQSP